MSASKVAAVLFDKDGTLMDFQQSWGRWAKAVVEDLTPNTQEAKRVAAAVGVDLDQAIFLETSPMIAGTPEEIVDLFATLLPQYDRAYLLERMMPDDEEFEPQLVAGLKEACLWMAGEGLGLAVVTNDFEETAHVHVRQMGLEALFKVVIGYDSGFGGKPAPDGCLAAARKLGVDPKACVMVGDSLHDLEAGKAAGMRRVAVLTGVAGAAELAPHADVVLDNAAQLPDWLTSL